MPEYYLTRDELYHHGIKGQHWGERRYQNEDGSLTAEGREHYGYGPAESRLKSAKDNLKGYRKEQMKRNLLYGTFGHMTKKGRDLDKQAYEAKKEVKAAKENLNKERYSDKVKAYQKQFNRASEMSDKSNDLFEDAKSQYKNLAKTSVGRMMEVMKAQRGKGSSAANKYLKTWNKASELGDRSLDEWTKAQSMHKETGKNYLHRVINNAKYQN